MTTKKISKIIVYYEDGTFEEIKAGVPDVQDKEHKAPATTSPVTPDLRPDTQKIREWGKEIVPNNPYYPPPSIPQQEPYQPWRKYDIWCTTDSTGNVPLKYTLGSDSGTWQFTSTMNFAPDNKYTITSTGNGNVDLSKQ